VNCDFGFSFWNLVFGIWCLEFDIWNLVFGIWFLEFGFWFLEFDYYGIRMLPAPIQTMVNNTLVFSFTNLQFL